MGTTSWFLKNRNAQDEMVSTIGISGRESIQPMSLLHLSFPTILAATFAYLRGPHHQKGKADMKLTPKEQDRLTIFTLAELARKRRVRGIKLNYPEAVALICDEMMEEARAGMNYEAVIAHGMQVLTEEDVMEGVAKLVETIFVEVLFDDGTKLITLSRPIRALREIQEEQDGRLSDMLTINAGKATMKLPVTNTSDHPVHITSHMPFWEINARMQFDRERSRGYRLDIPAGGAVRWEPGETKEVRLCLLI